MGALRGLSLRMLAVAGVGLAAGDLTWRGRAGATAPPPAGYLLLSNSVDWIWMSTLLLSVAGCWWSRRAPATRPGLALAQRAVGAGLTGVLALAMLTGCALFTWSLSLWDAALRLAPDDHRRGVGGRRLLLADPCGARLAAGHAR